MGYEENTRVTGAENGGRPIKRTVKDSVFTDLFGIKKYLLQFYQALHPDDVTTTEEDFTIVTIQNILTDGQFNDLGAVVGGTMLLLCEAQSKWSINILLRMLLYLADTYARYCKEHDIDVYDSPKAAIPKPELYVLFTGERKEKPEYISLRNDFFGDAECPVDVKIRMIYDGRDGDIISQYVAFTKVCDGQIRLHGRTQKAVEEVIRICKERDILREYLENREKEVRTIMGGLLTEDEIYRIHDMNIKKKAFAEGRSRGEKTGAIKGAIQMCQSMGGSKSDAKERVILQYNLTEDEAERKVMEFWIDKEDDMPS